jgi:hypothetical protein
VKLSFNSVEPGETVHWRAIFFCTRIWRRRLFSAFHTKGISAMREINLQNVVVVQAGLSWPHLQQPTNRSMLPFLERNEQFVSWLQPKNGSVDDQLATIKIGSKFYSLSLRLQKALFRHVRLQANFINRERLPDGRLKLRIPVSLLNDKRRTAARFSVRTSPCL